MTHEVIWHGPIGDVPYLVEADTWDDAAEQLSIWLCEGDEEFPEGIRRKE